MVATLMMAQNSARPTFARRPRAISGVNDPSILSFADVQAVVENAAKSVNSTSLVIAVTDRQGNLLALFREPDAPATAAANFGVAADASELAMALARTASFLSNDQAPLSSRTVRFISAIHFPPGIPYTGNGPLYGIENTNRGCGFNVQFAPGGVVPPARSINGAQPGLGIQTGKADLLDSNSSAVNPGGVPLFKQGALVGGVGVTGVSGPVAEYAAYLGAVNSGFGPTPAPPGVVFINGIALPFVDQTTAPPGTTAGLVTGVYILGPNGSPAAAPEGQLVASTAGMSLTQADVDEIINNAIATANQTRAVIRLPVGSTTRMTIAVADLDGSLLGLYRMADSTFFSIDVAVAKARNVVYFSGPQGTVDLPGVPAGTAITNRTIGFGAQPLFPPGIDDSGAGPFFNLYQYDTLNPCTQGSQASNLNQNGVVFFPGSLPLYKNGVLAGGLGVSGDGVDQDDYVTSGAAQGFAAPDAIQADQVVVDGVRLPYLKFPRNPTD